MVFFYKFVEIKNLFTKVFTSIYWNSCIHGYLQITKILRFGIKQMNYVINYVL